MKQTAGKVLGWGFIALLVGGCAATNVAPPSQGATPQARCSDPSGTRASPGAVTSSGSPIICE